MVNTRLTGESERIVAAITEEFNAFKTDVSNLIQTKNDEIYSLKSELSNVKARLTIIESKMSESDSKVRANNIVISGSGIPKQTLNENCIESVRDLFQNKLKLLLPSTDIVSASRLGKLKPNDENQLPNSPILIKFNNLEVKNNIINACRTVKINFSASDDLNQEKRSILFVLRTAKLKRPQIVDGSFTKDGKIFAWIKPTSPDDGPRNRKILVNTLEKLRSFCTNTLGAGIETFIKDWPQ